MLVYLVYLYFTVTITSSRKPNIVLIVTDDQDVTMNGLKPMVAAKKLIADLGVDSKNAFATTPICCPSRASILTGRYLHNTGENKAMKFNLDWKDVLLTDTKYTQVWKIIQYLEAVMIKNGEKI